MLSDILDYYIRKNNTLNKIKNEVIEEVINKILNYLELHDIEYNTYRVKVFTCLYLNPKKSPYYVIANDNNLDIKSLYNYRKRFNELADKIYFNLINKQNQKDF